ncbi:MAG TPA: Asp-tRNA(Asn)/Glu-tRNA(Gln) amidotransferase subunit GatB [Thermoanaerobaculia bacterium]|nr:Asp-tRNA(Asn)/Glu-tRNA(Gln) amidotransferase subunit GatB [Thermoanaerobaculia bacterium]
MSTWIAVIGLEVHARLLTESKLFCGCAVRFGAPPNSSVCPVCLGYPGTLPVLNRRAVELAIAAAVATGCEVQARSSFARKNYFYPDLPKGYQITQHDRPIATGGAIAILRDETPSPVPIRRIHLEEDAGKLLHETPWKDVPANVSLVDLNRAGVPLIEIVSEPELRSAAEAVEWASRLRQILQWAAVCDGNMEEGSLRIDANVSVRRKDDPLGTRAEIKNLNSFRHLSRAIEFEIGRQGALLESGATVVQETRSFDARSGETRPMRSKEEAWDYRYFDEPDLLDLEVGEEWIERVRRALPELPAARAARYARTWGVPPRDAEVLVATPAVARYFEAAAAASSAPQQVANWVRNEVLAVVNERGVDLDGWRLTPGRLASLVDLIDRGIVSGRGARQIFEAMAETSADPLELVDRLGVRQITDEAAIRAAARVVIERSPEQLEQYRSGRTRLLGYFVGKVIAETGGRANPEIVDRVVREMLRA